MSKQQKQRRTRPEHPFDMNHREWEEWKRENVWRNIIYNGIEGIGTIIIVVFVLWVSSLAGR